MKKELIESKLENLARCILRIESKKPFDLKKLKTDFDLQDVVVLNLERAVQVCIDLAAIYLSIHSQPSPNTMAASFDALVQLKLIDSNLGARLKKTVGFRNIAVHEYEKINWEIVYKIIDLCLDDLKTFGSLISKECL